MTKHAKKYSPLFFSSEDEQYFENKVKTIQPSLCFLDDCLWTGTIPPTKQSLSECNSRIVYLWDQDACPELPFRIQEDGRARGPTSGVVIQFVRCVLQDG